MPLAGRALAGASGRGSAARLTLRLTPSMLTVSMPPLACATARAPPRGDRPLEPGLVVSGAIVSRGHAARPAEMAARQAPGKPAADVHS